jgi:hypothetical protein
MAHRHECATVGRSTLRRDAPLGEQRHEAILQLQ